jgi:hypothetical protein
MNIKNYEPKKINLFIVEFPKEFDIQSWAIQKINKPYFLNNKWGNITVSFIDTIPESASKGLYNIINFLKENIKTDKILFEISIKTLDPVGNVVEEWIIQVEEVLNINFGNLNYADKNYQEPTLLIKPYNCILN